MNYKIIGKYIKNLSSDEYKTLYERSRLVVCKNLGFMCKGSLLDKQIQAEMENCVMDEKMCHVDVTSRKENTVTNMRQVEDEITKFSNNTVLVRA